MSYCTRIMAYTFSCQALYKGFITKREHT
jgi:hypothetical protein